ncbi:WD repeat-containing protein 74-like [Gigantopelta aegis]|uniref:WD repeat-containing protein 74-like n=1 Tax=Gigantopelta aegis TaxID=1735272 RepID=UPI001B8898F3|nr:WD repeat-containing protein 74-like [Gigantopelta aegis]
MAAPVYNVFVGTETGLLKGVSVLNNKWDNLNKIIEADKEKQICSLCWGNGDESEIFCGLKNNTVLIYDVNTQTFHDEIAPFNEEKGKLKEILKFDTNLVAGFDTGVVKIWKDENLTEINTGENLSCLVQNLEDQSKIATGGKENDLKVWDLNCVNEPVFKAKNVRNDWLNLHVPVWVLRIQFIPQSSKIVSCTGHHQVRVYDPSSPQRRPVLDMNFDEYPITSMSLRNDKEFEVVVGNTQGSMALLDLRQGKIIQKYKGFAGTFKHIQCHSSLPLVASCGLDRFLRIHDIESRELLHKFYLKSRLNCLLFSSKWRDADHEQIQETVPASETKTSVDSDDDVWEALEEVKSESVVNKKKSVKRKKVVVEKNLKVKNKKRNV